MSVTILEVGLHDRCAVPAKELAVPECMVGVAVCMRNHQIDRRDAAMLKPSRYDRINGATDRQNGAAGIIARWAAGVHEDSPRLAEQQIDEVALEAEALAHSQDKTVVVEFMHLDQRIGVVCAVGPWIQATESSGVDMISSERVNLVLLR